MEAHKLTTQIMARFSPRAHAGTSAHANHMTLREPGATRKENPDEPLVKILAYTSGTPRRTYGAYKWSVQILLDRIYNTTAKRIQQAPRKIFLYKRADIDGLRDHLARFRDTFLSSDNSHMSVNDMWVSFKSEVIAAIERFIPTKMTKTKYSLP